MNPLLIAYRLAWEPALGVARGIAALEKLAGRRLTPARWRLAERLSVTSSDAEKPHGSIWLHAASLGECKGLWAFAQVLQTELEERAKTHPDTSPKRIVLTTNTTAGLDYLRDEITRLVEKSGEIGQNFSARLAPLDHPRLARRFIKAYDVRALILFEVELWPHWIAATKPKKGRAGASVFWISARLTERARRRYAGNRLVAGAFRRVLRGIDWIQVQREDEEHALRRLGGTAARAVETGGDLRGLHSLSRLSQNPPTRRGLALISLHAHELAVLAPHIRKALRVRNPPAPVYVFPRRLEEAPLFLAQLASEGFVLHSRLPGAPRVIVDAFGLVGDALPHVHTAVIGGSFGNHDSASALIGGHNVWEPFVSGCRIIIGPHHENQRALVELLKPTEWLQVSEDGSAIGATDTAGAEQYDARHDLARAEFLRVEHARLQASAQRVLKQLFQHLGESV